ncbi:hypothetical protein [Moraxella lacunata]
MNGKPSSAYFLDYYQIFHGLPNFFHLFFYIYPPKWGIIFRQISM